jgi:hypothetical protein
MSQAAFDADALISMFETASTRGSAKLRESVEQATLAALQGRKLTLKNIRGALESVTSAVSQGAVKNIAGIDAGSLLDKEAIFFHDTAAERDGVEIDDLVVQCPRCKSDDITIDSDIDGTAAHMHFLAEFDKKDCDAGVLADRHAPG